MRTKIIRWVAFAFMVTAQVGVPAQMIYQRENILATGQEFKFRVAPLDPNDPFRGKYINLHFTADSIEVSDKSQYQYNQTIYLQLVAGSDGMAGIKTITKTKPAGAIPYLKTKVAYVNTDNEGKQTVFIEYPFNRFYMEETKAPLAEKLYATAAIDSTIKAWALVAIKNGEGVLKDVFLDGVPIAEKVTELKSKN